MKISTYSTFKKEQFLQKLFVEIQYVVHGRHENSQHCMWEIRKAWNKNKTFQQFIERVHWTKHLDINCCLSFFCSVFMEEFELFLFSFDKKSPNMGFPLGMECQNCFIFCIYFFSTHSYSSYSSLQENIYFLNYLDIWCQDCALNQVLAHK
jgi:hypothetical protein